MKYLHIIPPSKRMMDTYIRMIRTYFKEEDHQFYFISTCPNSERVLFKYGNVHEMIGKNRYEKAINLYRTLKSANHIIWHSFIYPNRIMLFLSCNPRFLKKSIWIMWGLDLHNWKLPANSIHNIIKNFLNLHCRKMIGHAIALVEQDKEYFHAQISSKIPCDVVPLPLSEDAFALMDRYNQNKPRANGKTFIQIAHNAYAFNQHLEILQALKKFKDENLRLYLPLSYGNGNGNRDTRYVSEVKAVLEEDFSNKYYCLSKLIPPLEYTDFLWNIDIAIFNANRQNALGNILRLLYMGNKVFLRSDGPLYNFFINHGINVYDSTEIKNMSYDEFIIKPDNTLAQRWIRENYHPMFNYKKWCMLFQNIEPCTLNEIPLKYVDPSAEMLLSSQITYKRNYINVTPYLNARQNYTNVKRLVIIGTGLMGRNVLQLVNDINCQKLNWSLDGYLDNEFLTFQNAMGDIDIIGTISGWYFTENQYAICAIEDSIKRQQLITSIKQSVIYASLIHPFTMISEHSVLGEGCIVGPFSSICEGAHIGNHTFVLGALIQNDVHIGDYCTIKNGVIIKYGATIKAGATIEENVVIPENTTIPEYSHITLGSGCLG